MTEIEVKALVPTERLEQLIGSGDPTSAEVHDMAVELINRRSAADGKAQPIAHASSKDWRKNHLCSATRAAFPELFDGDTEEWLKAFDGKPHDKEAFWRANLKHGLMIGVKRENARNRIRAALASLPNGMGG